jgi:hypothetical protein
VPEGVGPEEAASRFLALLAEGRLDLPDLAVLSRSGDKWAGTASKVAGPGAPVLRWKKRNAVRGASESDPAVREALDRQGGGVPLGDADRERMEARFGADFRDVRIHNDSAADRAARALDADAFTTGNRIQFAREAFAPGTGKGDRLLAHELAHVVQQQQGSVPAGIGPSEPGEAVEVAAEALVRDAFDGHNTLVSPAVHPVPTAGRILAWQHRTPRQIADGTVLSEEQVASIQSDLAALGVTRMGNLSALATWSDEQIDQAFARLRRMDAGRGPGGAYGAPRRTVLSWNQGTDGRRDLSRFPTILHFVLTSLDAAAGGDYEEVVEDMEGARLAGSTVTVHPRMLYFMAAAQVGMDRQAGRAEGEGHYIPAGGFQVRLAEIRRMLQQITRSPEPSSGAMVCRMRSELLEMAQVLRSQDGEEEAVRGHGRDEHQEPELREFFRAVLSDRPGHPMRWRAIDDTPEHLRDEQAAAAATELLGILGTPPAGRHGSAAADPHGVEHGVGTAIDLYNGRGSPNGVLNRAPEREYWPFLHHLMQRFGSPGLRGLRPARIDELQPAQRRELSRIVQEHGLAEQEALRPEAERRRAERQAAARAPAPRRARGEPPPPVPAETRFAQFHQRVLRLMRRHINQLMPAELRPLDASRAIQTRAGAIRQRANQDATAVQASSRSLTHGGEGPVPLTPDAIQAMLRRQREELTGLARDLQPGATVAPAPEGPEGREARRAATAAGRTRTARETWQTEVRDLLDGEAPEPDSPPTFRSVQAEIDTNRAAWSAAQARMQENRLDALVLSQPFRTWLTSAARSGIYDQADTVIAGIESVRSHPGPGTEGAPSRILGGHHAELAPVEVVRSDDAYRDALRRDMSRRRPDDLRRILGAMAESAAGRLALFGNESGQGADRILTQEMLPQFVGGPEAARQMIDEIRQRMAVGGTERSVRAQMRDSGYH